MTDVDAISAQVASLLEPHDDQSAHSSWALSSAPELLMFLARLRIPSYPKLEGALTQLLLRDQLPEPTPEVWAELSAVHGIVRPTLRRRRGGRVALPPPPPLPAAYRLAQAMATLPVRGHGVWQLLAERHVARPGQLLDVLSPDQLTVLAAAFARGGYHPVELFGSIAERLLLAVPRLQSGSLARGLHAFARLRHQDSALAAALCEEVHVRMCGHGASAGAGGASGGAGGLLSLAGAALFGGGGLAPDRAHRVPPFTLDDLARLAEAAVALGAGEEAARRWAAGAAGSGPSVGSISGSGGSQLGDALLAVVAEEAAAAAAERAASAAAAAISCDIQQDSGAVEPAELGPSGRSLFRGETDSETIGARRLRSGVGDAAGVRAPRAAMLGDPAGSWADSIGELEGGRRAPNGAAEDGCGVLPVAEQLEPVLSLLGALVAGAAGGGESGSAAQVAYCLAVKKLAPKLLFLEPHLSPQQLLAHMAALLPRGGAAAAALRGRALPYPLAPQPQPSQQAAGDSTGGTARSYSPADQLLAVAEILRARCDPRASVGASQLLAAWHMLAAARAAGADGAADPQSALELMPAVCGAIAHCPWLVSSPTEARRFLVSCAVLSAFHRPALDVAAATLVTALGGGSSDAAARRQNGGGRAAAASGVGVGSACVEPGAMAQLAWAVGQLGYDNQELLAAIQSRALSLSASLIGQRGGEGAGGPRGNGGAPAGGGGGGAPSPSLGPLELADVMWALTVNEFRSSGGAELRELYMRAASSGVVSIDDPRWLTLARVHVVLLLGWAGGLGPEAAAALRSSWFNALGYAWERQAVYRGEHLAGRHGVPPDPDEATYAFRHSVYGTARDLLRGASREGRGGWRLEGGYVWGMMRPSSDIRLTVPVLLRREGRLGAWQQQQGGAGAGSEGEPAWPGEGGGGEAGLGLQWLALDVVRRADEAITWQEGGAQAGGSQEAAAPERPRGVWEPVTPAGPSGPLDGEATAREQTFSGQGQGQDQTQGRAQGSGQAQAQGHLLGPARWRQLVLRQLGVLVRPIRQEAWERAGTQQRRLALREALRL